MSCWDEAIKLEQDVAKYHARQCLNGVGFDMEEATHLANHLERELKAVIRLIMKDIPLKAKQHLTTVNKPFLKNRDMSKSVLEWYGTKNDVVAPFTRITFEPLNINSHIQIKDYLLTQGWQPTTYTEKGSPKLTEDSYHSVKGDVGRLLAKKNVLTHRLNMVRNPSKEKGFIYMVRDDGCIEADAITLGAATGRYAHIGVANLPRPTTAYGAEIRSLFCVPESRIMLGWDLSGIENRIAAHYLSAYDKGVFAKEVLEGDFHQTTADAIGISRNEAKTFRYMTLYGGRPKKIAATMGWKLAKARKVYKAFWEKEKALTKLQKALESAIKKGYIKGLDGRKLYPRSQHALINFLFQSAATIVFKKALVLMNEGLDRASIDWKQLIAYHDEAQLEICEKDVDIVSEVVQHSVQAAGEYYNLTVPIECDIKVGRNWADCH